MKTRFFIGNLAPGLTEAALVDLLATVGTIESVQMINPGESGVSRGFAYVVLTLSLQDADAAIAKIQGAELLGSRIRVTVADTMGAETNRKRWSGNE